MSIVETTRGLLRAAAHEDPALAPALYRCERRLDRPLRVALTGTVKSGKSTLLNALAGAEVAATDTLECTRGVTAYQRWGRWTLVDTPGVASNSAGVAARTPDFLARAYDPADVVVHLARSLHETDLDLLRLIRERGDGRRPLGVVVVLSRADETAGPGEAPLAAARRASARLRADARLSGLVDDVVPVSGLLALRGATLSTADRDLLVALAALPADVLDAALVSPERLRAAGDPVPAGAARLLEPFGMVGLRAAIGVVGSGVVGSGVVGSGVPEGRTPGAALVAASGIGRLRRRVDARFGSRHAELSARAALRDLAAVLHGAGRGAGPVARRVGALLADTHVVTELRALDRLPGLDVPVGTREALRRTLGGLGTAPHTRLGLSGDASDERLRAAALAGVRRWRHHVDDPLLDPAAVGVLRAAARSCEGVLAAEDRGHRVTGREIALAAIA